MKATGRLHHYKESGLDNVWLLRNGFTVRQTAYGEAASIDDVDGLPARIARDLVEKPEPLTGPEIRFLRKHLDRSRRELAGLMGADEQTVSRWERGATTMPPAADRLLRAFHREAKEGNARLMDLLKRVAVRDDKSGKAERRIELTRSRRAATWKVAA